MKFCVFSFLFLIIGSTLAHAEIKATVDRQEMFFGESLTLTIISDQNTNSQPDFTLLDAVFHVGQTSKSSSTQIINGNRSSQTSWQVLLVPKTMGSHIIPPIEVDGERTQALKIEVKKPDPNAQAKGDIFIEIETDKTSAFVQEEILLTVRLLYAINLKNGALSEPGAAGVIVQQINKGTNYTTQRDGKTYQVLERKYAIFAENSGPLTLNPLVFEGEVTDNSRSSYGLFQRGRPIRQVSEMLELEIKQIPQAFVNKNWIPAKQLTLTQNWSQEKPYRVGEPLTRTIKLTAIGLSETQLPDLDINTINGARIYQDKTDTMTRTDGQQLIATKTIKYAVIPNQKGELDIPELTVEWFDTNKQTAQKTTLPATVLPIEAAITNSTKTPKAIDFNPVKTPQTQAVPAIEETVASDQLTLWQTLTWVFAALWILTTVLLWRRPQTIKSTPIEQTIKNPISLKNINQADASQVQQTLIAWWNQHYGQNTTNLGQIISQLEDQEMKSALNQLQQRLYHQSPETTPINWQLFIKQNRLKPAGCEAKISKGLPELYEHS